MDPNPLLTTSATAAAALVAIVGALLVSRVVNLASERSGFEQRLADLRARLTAAKARAEALEDRLLHSDTHEVLWEGREQFAEGGPVDIGSMINEAGVDRTVEEIRPFVEAEAERYRAIREYLEPAFADGPPEATLDDLRENGLIVVNPEDETAYELVWDVLEAENPGPPQSSHPLGVDFPTLLDRPVDIGWPTVHAIRSTAEVTEHATLRRDADAARHQVDALNVQIEQTELAAARVSRPSGVTGGLFVLGYMTTTGVLVPLGLIASGLESMNRWGGAGIVALFASGVGLLMVYVGVEVHRMTATPSLQGS